VCPSCVSSFELREFCMLDDRTACFVSFSTYFESSVHYLVWRTWNHALSLVISKRKSSNWTRKCAVRRWRQHFVEAAIKSRTVASLSRIQKQKLAWTLCWTLASETLSDHSLGSLDGQQAKYITENCQLNFCSIERRR